MYTINSLTLTHISTKLSLLTSSPPTRTRSFRTRLSHYLSFSECTNRLLAGTTTVAVVYSPFFVRNSCFELLYLAIWDTGISKSCNYNTSEKAIAIFLEISLEYLIKSDLVKENTRVPAFKGSTASGSNDESVCGPQSKWRCPLPYVISLQFGIPRTSSGVGCEIGSK